MSEQPPSPPEPRPEPAPGLPPVLPPSGSHIVRLFVVPAAIVALVVGFLLLLMVYSGASGWLFGIGRTPDACLADMRSENPDVRWRAANELAQQLAADKNKGDRHLSADAKLGLDLADALNGALADLDREEQAYSEQLRLHLGESNPPPPVPAKLKAQRKYVQFLSASLGYLTVPVGAPLLTRIAQREEGDPKTLALLRRHAVFALANLGENRKQFDKLPADLRDKALAVLDAEAKGNNPNRAEWARKTLNGLNGQDFGVIDALAECAGLSQDKTTKEYRRKDKANDPDLRAMTAFAVGFWSDTPDKEKRADAEKILLALSNPDQEQGQGERVVLDKDD